MFRSDDFVTKTLFITLAVTYLLTLFVACVGTASATMYAVTLHLFGQNVAVTAAATAGFVVSLGIKLATA